MPSVNVEGFTFYLATAGMFAGIDPINHIVGSGSLRLHRNAIAARFITGEPTNAPKGFTSGTMRALYRPVTPVSNDWVGMCFQKSTADLTAGAGQAYGAGLVVSGSFANLEICKFTAGLGTRSAIVSSSPGLAFNSGSTISLSITWLLDIVRLGGLRITLSQGTATDFSSMTQVLDTVVTTSILLTSVGEGPALSLVSTASAGDYLWDQTDAVPLIVA